MVSRWSVVDFILIWLGGVLGTGVFYFVGAVSGDESWTIIFGLAGQYVGNLGVFWILARRKDDPDVGFSIQGRDFGYIALGLLFQILIAVLFLPISNLLFPEGRPQEVANLIAEAESLPLVITLILTVVVIDPATEELIFRGVLLKALEPRGRRFALVSSALVFSAVHVFGLDLDRLWQSTVVVLPPLFLLGLVLARMTQRSGRLGPAIFLHSGFNLLAAVILLLPPEILEQVG